MLISPEYMSLQKDLHAGGSYGISAGVWVSRIMALATELRAETILDYGCGTGQLRNALGDRVKEYDPCIEGKDGDPEPADLVVCTDVMEHIEPECLDRVLQHMRSKVKNKLFLTISLIPATKFLKDGRNAHILLQSETWWKQRLSPYFKEIEWEVNDGKEIMAVCQPVGLVGNIKAIGVLSNEQRNDHTRINVLKTPRRIPDSPVDPHDTPLILAAYGPSLRDTYPLIEIQCKQLNAKIVTVSGAHDFLRSHLITPDFHVECDPRADKMAMFKSVSRKTEFMLASCCHPDLVDKLSKHKLTLWHLFNGEESFAIRDIKSEATAALIPGGGSVGLRTLTLFYFLGYRNFICHGLDSSFADTQWAGPHPGKKQNELSVRPKIDLPDGRTIWSDNWYTTSPVLITYAQHLLKDIREGRYAGANFYVFGKGLFQEMLRLEQIERDELIKMGKVKPPSGDYFNLTESEIRPEERAS